MTAQERHCGCVEKGKYAYALTWPYAGKTGRLHEPSIQYGTRTSRRIGPFAMCKVAPVHGPQLIMGCMQPRKNKKAFHQPDMSSQTGNAFKGRCRKRIFFLFSLLLSTAASSHIRIVEMKGECANNGYVLKKEQLETKCRARQ